MHRIRLRGPWDVLWLKTSGSEEPTPMSGALRMPVSWNAAFGRRAGRVRLTRHFNRPTGIDDGERVWLEIAIGVPAHVAMNGLPLGEVVAGTVRFDVTDRLEEYGRVEIEFDRPEYSDGEQPIAEVALVIEMPA